MFLAAAPPLMQGLTIPARAVPLFRAIFLVLVLGSAFILQLNFRSLRYQRITEEEILTGTLSTSADVIVNGLPSIPDLNSSGEPVDVIKARYLINDKKLDEALLILKQYNRSPYDSRKEYFIAMAYGMKGENESALAVNDSAIKYLPGDTLLHEYRSVLADRLTGPPAAFPVK
jgi:putative inorganic carbon (hco3(-)) transporter